MEGSMPWQKLTNKAQVLAVHAAYMGFGRILYFGGDEFDADHNKHHQFDATRLFDCNALTVKTLSSPPFDTFCCGHAFVTAVNQARLLVAGGTEQHYLASGYHQHHFPGLRDAAIFNSPLVSNPTGPWDWTKADRMNPGMPVSPGSIPPGTQMPDPNLNGGRWYPTLTTMATGDVIAFAGHPGSGDLNHDNDIPEVYSPKPGPLGKWRQLAPYSNGPAREYYQNHSMVLYPRVHLVPSGHFIFSSPQGRQTLAFRPDVGAFGGTFDLVCIFPRDVNENYSYPNSPYHWNSVLLPLGFRRNHNQWDSLPTRILICGGTSERAHVLDVTKWPTSPTEWKATGARAISKARLNSNATILPTGEIFVNGGVNISEDELTRQVPILDSRGTNEPEIYNPYTNKWTVLSQPNERASVPRNYHSVSLLMPDGRVWTAGSSKNSAPGIATRNLDIEIFEPWYWGNPDRPYINDAPSLAYPGTKIQISSTFANEIERVVVLRAGSCTHSFNPDQRMVELKFRHLGGDKLEVDMPADNYIYPPGHYLIYTIRHHAGTLGLPSFGTDIHVVTEREAKEAGHGH
jgi:hypothetical protein